MDEACGLCLGYRFKVGHEVSILGLLDIVTQGEDDSRPLVIAFGLEGPTGPACWASSAVGNVFTSAYSSLIFTERRTLALIKPQIPD